MCFFGRVGAITKNKIEKKFVCFFNFRKFRSVGSVNEKLKNSGLNALFTKIWPVRTVHIQIR